MESESSSVKTSVSYIVILHPSLRSGSTHTRTLTPTYTPGHCFSHSSAADDSDYLQSHFLNVSLVESRDRRLQSQSELTPPSDTRHRRNTPHFEKTCQDVSYTLDNSVNRCRERNKKHQKHNKTLHHQLWRPSSHELRLGADVGFFFIFFSQGFSTTEWPPHPGP